MLASIHSNIQLLGAHLTTNSCFSDTTKKYGKITAVVLAVLSVLTLSVVIYHRFIAEKAGLNQDSPPLFSVIRNLFASRVRNVEERVEIIEEQDDKTKRKIQEIACLPFVQSNEILAYASEDAIREKGGIVLTNNYYPSGANFYRGIVALPENGKYYLHLCPGGGYLRFDRKQIDTLMSEATQELMKQNIAIAGVVENVGRHPGNTIENFKRWQADQRKV